MTFGLVLVGGSLASHSAVLRAQSAVQTHIGHVTESFQATPNQQGLLPTALAEAKIATQHAGLALKAPDNLDAIKLHAGHVINAIDPSVEAKGPGLGFGVKRAAAGVAQHIQLAAKSEGASANVKTHATHVAGAAGNVATRADAVVALAQKVRAAGTAAEASSLMMEVQTAVNELTAGVDANKDGRVNWDAPEGGLQQAQQHIDLLRKGEGQ
ncbi:MAG: hypothetical protein A3K13_10335 [Gemmatimonadetes bacterium RIFCSPLOWO2_12_FULL_68_9]|nr:MAG: hypothetical protein A3K13_10335 [Gemmatimonadetes bacterium RIFCSPLOWO2_12_FULL_68_9]